MESEMFPYIFQEKEMFSVTDQNLRDLLEKLHKELEHTESTDEKGREMLRRLEADIETLLARSGSGAVRDESLLVGLQDAIDHFEATHPTLTKALSDMMTILSNAGI
jgi:hypothetical protein